MQYISHFVFSHFQKIIALFSCRDIMLDELDEVYAIYIHIYLVFCPNIFFHIFSIFPA